MLHICKQQVNSTERVHERIIYMSLMDASIYSFNFLSTWHVTCKRQFSSAAEALLHCICSGKWSCSFSSMPNLIDGVKPHWKMNVTTMWLCILMSDHWSKWNSFYSKMRRENQAVKCCRRIFFSIPLPLLRVGRSWQEYSFIVLF